MFQGVRCGGEVERVDDFFVYRTKHIKDDKKKRWEKMGREKE